MPAEQPLTNILIVPVSHPSRWIAVLHQTTAQISFHRESIWVKYSANDQEIQRVESQLPGVRYRLIEGELLVRHGKHVAESSLPELEWLPVAEVVELRLPTPAMSGTVSSNTAPTTHRPAIELVRGGLETDSHAGLFHLNELARWVELAPAVRLNRLCYCVSQNEALVVGTPLPPIACQHLVQHERVLIPTGMCWKPAIDVASVCSLFDVDVSELLVWIATNEWSMVHRDALQTLSRSSIRAVLQSRGTQDV